MPLRTLAPSARKSLYYTFVRKRQGRGSASNFVREGGYDTVIITIIIIRCARAARAWVPVITCSRCELSATTTTTTTIISRPTSFEEAATYLFFLHSFLHPYLTFSVSRFPRQATATAATPSFLPYLSKLQPELAGHCNAFLSNKCASLEESLVRFRGRAKLLSALSLSNSCCTALSRTTSAS